MVHCMHPITEKIKTSIIIIIIIINFELDKEQGFHMIFKMWILG